MWAMCGDYSFPAMTYFWKMIMEDLDHPHVVGLLEGMKSRKPSGVEILYSRGCDWSEEIETKFRKDGDERAWDYEILHRKVDSGEKADKQEALQMAAQSDVIIAAVGENVMLCGENRDRQGLRLPGKQEQYVEELLKTGKPVVLVIFGGRAQVVSGIAERCAAVIQAWYPGEKAVTQWLTSSTERSLPRQNCLSVIRTLRFMSQSAIITARRKTHGYNGLSVMD